MIRKFAAVALIGMGIVLAGCTNVNDADVASQNISTDADNFKILRQIVGVNAFTDKYLIEIIGYCNIRVDREDKQLEVTCKRPDGYVKHYLGASDNTPYTVLQLEAADVSVDHYKVTIKPTTVIPHVEFR